MPLIGRLFAIVFAVVLAFIAAGAAIALGVLGPQWHALSGDIGERVSFWILVVFASSYAGAVALMPILVFVVVAEIYRLRSLLVCALASVVAMLIGYYGSGFEGTVGESIDAPPAPISRNAELAAAAGAVFGITYWLVAGRNAGRWRERM